MCYNVVIEFKYIDRYKQAKEDRWRLKYIIRYGTAL